jgi:hypothetical protein
MTSRFPDLSADHSTVSRWLNQCENDHDLVIYLGDETAGAWTQKAVRQADQVIICVHGVPTKELNEAEECGTCGHHSWDRPIETADALSQRKPPNTRHYHSAFVAEPGR